MQLLFAKISGIFIRLGDLIRLLPIRALRVFAHGVDGIEKMGEVDFKRMSLSQVAVSIGFWWLELFVLLLDLLGIGELYETLADFIKFNTRPLKSWETKVAKEVFGNAINFKRVRVDEWAFVGPPQMKVCYVSCYIINSWGKMNNATLIHELVHVWQYQHIGLIYIPRALRAQHTKVGYDYGGLSQLKRYIRQEKTIFAFNLEQQAEIVSDYYNLKNGYPTQWSRANFSDLPVYEHFVDQLRETQA